MYPIDWSATWTGVGAMATWVAVGVAFYAWKATAKTLKVQQDQLRLQAVGERSRRDQELRNQATKVYATTRNVPEGEVIVHNGSHEPIYEVFVSLPVFGDHSLGSHDGISMIGPGEQWAPTGLQARRSNIELFFKDAAGHNWFRSRFGVLLLRKHETATPEERLLAAEQHEHDQTIRIAKERLKQMRAGAGGEERPVYEDEVA